MLAGPYQHPKAAIFDALRAMAAAIFASAQWFSGRPLLDYQGAKQLHFSSHLRERDKMLLRRILCGGVFNGFLLGKSKEEDVPCRFCGSVDGDGHLIWVFQFPFRRESGKILSLRPCWPATVVPGPAIWPGVVGYLLYRLAELAPWAVAVTDSVDATLEAA